MTAQLSVYFMHTTVIKLPIDFFFFILFSDGNKCDGIDQFKEIYTLHFTFTNVEYIIYLNVH